MKRAVLLILLVSFIVFTTSCSQNKPNENTFNETSSTQSSSNFESSSSQETVSSEDTSSLKEVSSKEEVSSAEQKTSIKEVSSVAKVPSTKKTSSVTPKDTTKKDSSVTPKDTTKKPPISAPKEAKKSSTTTTQQTPKPSKSNELETVELTFMEGSSLAKMMDVLEEYEVCNCEDLLKVVNEYDYSYYPLVAEIPSSPNRCFKLEGYIFPDTYEFYIDEKPQDAIGRFLKVAEKKIKTEYRERATELGYSMDEIITLASIVEKEVGDTEQMSTVASIFYNRLNQGERLQSDATINYVERSIKPYISGDKNRYNSYYNTYKCKALPEGPICNPGIAAIKAALYPEETDYLFFVSDKEGNYYYSSTYEEHLANCEIAGINVE